MPKASWQGEWDKLLVNAKEANRLERHAKDAKEASRIFKNVHDFRKYILPEDKAFSRTAEIDTWLSQHEGKGNKD